MGAGDTHRLPVIAFNARSEMSAQFKQADLALGQAVDATSAIPLNAYNFDSLTLLRRAFDGLASAAEVDPSNSERARSRASTRALLSRRRIAPAEALDHCFDPCEPGIHVPAEVFDAVDLDRDAFAAFPVELFVLAL